MARFNHGWIKLHRSLADKDIAQNPILLSLWVTLLMKANYKPSQIIWQGKQRILQPGQCLIKFRSLSIMWGCSAKTIAKWIHYLSNTGRIEINAVTTGTIVTICNWKEFQLDENSEVTPSKHGGNTGYGGRGNTEVTPDENQLHLETRTQSRSPVYNAEANNFRGNTEVTPSKHGGNYIKKERKKNIIGGIRLNYPPIFISLWERYGKVGNKKPAFEVFEKLNLSPEEIEQLQTAITNYYQRKEAWRSAQHFSTFLNSDWRQYLEEVPPLENGHALPNGNLNHLTEEELIERGFKLPPPQT